MPAPTAGTCIDAQRPWYASQSTIRIAYATARTPKPTSTRCSTSDPSAIPGRGVSSTTTAAATATSEASSMRRKTGWDRLHHPLIFGSDTWRMINTKSDEPHRFGPTNSLECGGEDSNLHARKEHGHLKPARKCSPPDTARLPRVRHDPQPRAPPPPPLGTLMRELHMRHHFQRDTRGFGVSAP